MVRKWPPLFVTLIFVSECTVSDWQRSDIFVSFARYTSTIFDLGFVKSILASMLSKFDIIFIVGKQLFVNRNIHAVSCWDIIYGYWLVTFTLPVDYQCNLWTHQWHAQFNAWISRYFINDYRMLDTDPNWSWEGALQISFIGFQVSLKFKSMRFWYKGRAGITNSLWYELVFSVISNWFIYSHRILPKYNEVWHLFTRCVSMLLHQ